MAPHGWTNDEQSAFLESWIPSYLDYQAKKDLNGFWPLLREAWFKKFPPAHTLTNLDPSLLSSQDQVEATQAISNRRKVLRFSE